MTLYEEKMKYYSFVVALIGIISLLVYLLTPLQSYSLGLFIGLIFGYVNLWTIYRKTIVVGRAASSRGTHQSVFSLVWAGLGFLVRAAIALFAIWLAFLYPENIHLLSVITGFSLIYIIILIDMIIQFVRKR